MTSPSLYIFGTIYWTKQIPLFAENASKIVLKDVSQNKMYPAIIIYCKYKTYIVDYNQKYITTILQRICVIVIISALHIFSQIVHNYWHKLLSWMTVLGGTHPSAPHHGGCRPSIIIGRQYTVEK